MKLALLSLLTAACALAQTATFSHFQNPNIQGVTIGSRYCYLWFHSATQLPAYVFEGACYGGAAPALQFLPPDTAKITQMWNFPGGAVGWIVERLPDGTLKLSLEAKGPDDPTEIRLEVIL